MASEGSSVMGQASGRWKILYLEKGLCTTPHNQKKPLTISDTRSPLTFDPYIFSECKPLIILCEGAVERQT